PRSLRLLGKDVALVVPSGAGRLLDDLGFRSVTELTAGERLVKNGVTLTATRAAHGGFRPPFGPRADAIGYLVDAVGARTYFAGDTDLFAGMADFAPLDVALLPVWGWGPNLRGGHLDPARAARAVTLLRPGYVIPIHW